VINFAIAKQASSVRSHHTRLFNALIEAVSDAREQQIDTLLIYPPQYIYVIVVCNT